MTTNNITTQKPIKTLINAEITREKFKEVLGKKAPAFMASLLAVINGNTNFEKVDSQTVLSAAMTAATLDLPINSNLGFAYIIPYAGKAQFQIGYKGFIQLAMRSGLFRTINVTDVKEGEITSMNRLTGKIDWNWIDGQLVDRDKVKTIGYVAYMELLTGFEKSMYMTVEQLKNHGGKYSQTMKYNKGLWVDNFDAMAQKTVIKLMLSKYAPLTTDMQVAQLADQAVIKGEGDYEYIDNKNVGTEPNPEYITEKQIDKMKQLSNYGKLSEDERIAFDDWVSGLTFDEAVTKIQEYIMDGSDTKKKGKK